MVKVIIPRKHGKIRWGQKPGVVGLEFTISHENRLILVIEKLWTGEYLISYINYRILENTIKILKMWAEKRNNHWEELSKVVVELIKNKGELRNNIGNRVVHFYLDNMISDVARSENNGKGEIIWKLKDCTT